MPVAYQNESYVADAHALVWHIAEDKRLGKEAKAILTQADQALVLVYVPTIVLAEVIPIVHSRTVFSKLGRSPIALGGAGKWPGILVLTANAVGLLPTHLWLLKRQLV